MKFIIKLEALFSEVIDASFPEQIVRVVSTHWVLYSLAVAADPDFMLPDPFTITFDNMSVNGTSECANIDVPQDQALEGDHDFTVQLSTLSPDLVSIDSPEAAEIIIVDDDSKCIVNLPMWLFCGSGIEESCAVILVSHMILYTKLTSPCIHVFVPLPKMQPSL